MAMKRRRAYTCRFFLKLHYIKIEHMDNKKLSSKGWERLKANAVNIMHGGAIIGDNPNRKETITPSYWETEMNPMVIDSKVFDRLHVVKTKEDGRSDNR